jgi:hypothetical protein
MVVEWWNEGWHAKQIAEACDVVESVIYYDLRKMSVKRDKRYRWHEGALPPLDWRNPPAFGADPDPADRLFLVGSQLIRAWREIRGESAHASQLSDARRTGNQSWITKWDRVVADLAHIVGVLAAQHDGAVDLRSSLATWVDASVLSSFDEAAAGATGDRIPAGLADEMWQLVDAGLEPGRRRLVAKYGVNELTVRIAYARALERKRLLEAGWRPPPS